MWRAKDDDPDLRHLAAEVFYVCRILAFAFWLLGVVRAGDTYRQVQYYMAGQFRQILNPFWLGFNGFTALLFFVAGIYLWTESKGPHIKRDNPKTNQSPWRDYDY